MPKRYCKTLELNCQKDKAECHLERENGHLRTGKYLPVAGKSFDQLPLTGQAGSGGVLGQEKVCLSEGGHHYGAHLPCNTRISHRRSLLENQGRCKVGDADCSRILLLRPSAAGWPSPCPSHSYVLQTGLSSNRQSTGICPFNQNGFRDEKHYLLN